MREGGMNLRGFSLFFYSFQSIRERKMVKQLLTINVKTIFYKIGKKMRWLEKTPEQK